MKLKEEKIVRYLYENEGECITSYQLVKKAKAYDGDLSKLDGVDLFELNDEVHRIAEENGFMLYMRHHDNKVEGMPFSLDFVIRSMNRAVVKTSYEGIEDDLIYRNIARGYYFPTESSISVYDRDKDNVVIYRGMYDPYDRRAFSIPCDMEKVPAAKRTTVDNSVLNQIKTLIRESGVLEIRSFEGVDYDVLDGEANSFFFSDGDKRTLIECDNFYMLYDGYGEETNAGKVMKMVDKIESILERNML